MKQSVNANQIGIAEEFEMDAVFSEFVEDCISSIAVKT
jgi:hypothetical protein